MTQPTTVSEISRQLQADLTPLYGGGEAKAMVRLIFHALKGWNLTDMVIHADNEVSSYILDKIENIKNRLLKNEPIQYILGEASFYGMKLMVNRQTLIPRPETEELVDLIIQENDRSDLKVLDIGTGSGAIAIALSRNLRFPEIIAIDISEGALEVARLNATRMKAGIEFIHADIFNWNPPVEKFDIIVSNPPYIDNSEKSSMERNVLDYEPHSALFVPDDNPLIFYSRIAEVGVKALKEGGRLYFEINPNHSEELAKMLKSEGYQDIITFKDSYDRTRFIKAALK